MYLRGLRKPVTAGHRGNCRYPRPGTRVHRTELFASEPGDFTGWAAPVHRDRNTDSTSLELSRSIFNSIAAKTGAVFRAAPGWPGNSWPSQRPQVQRTVRRNRCCAPALHNSAGALQRRISLRKTRPSDAVSCVMMHLLNSTDCWRASSERRPPVLPFDMSMRVTLITVAR